MSDRGRRGARRGTAAAALLLVSACSGGGGGTTPPTAPTTIFIADGDPSPTDQAIAAAQRRLVADPGDAAAQLALASAFLQKARETADPSLYTKASGLLDGIDGRAGDEEPLRLVVAGQLALTRHEFAAGLDLGRRALALAPRNEGAYGVVVDALNELGRYDEALEATQEMVDARPALAGLSRVSYARELRGDLRGATTSMQQAIASAGPTAGENVAYLQVIVGDLLLQQGDVAGADAAYDAAERSFPGFAPVKVGRARALVARGRPADAAVLLQQAVDVQPLPETAAALGDALAAAGDAAGARRAYDLVDVISRLQAANGIDNDLEVSLFEADHAPGPGAVALARRAAAARPGVFGFDALAWNLFRAGQVDEAYDVAQRATALGTATPALRFHAAAIAAAHGRRDEAATLLAPVLAGNPRFSARLLPEVEALAAQLGLVVPPVPS